tara:strand:+ start:86 stop:547 length:462 start_codon:yes stop_codon:yes gene_type:complete
MKVYKLRFKQNISKPIEEVFSFFAKPENLALITPRKLDFKILTPIPIRMKEGQLIDYTIKLFKKEIRWKTLITEYDKPKKFIDQQLKGPYSMWHHTHTFNDHGTYVEMIDEISYSVPFGIIGQIVNSIFIKRDLLDIFEYRKKVIDKYFKEKK